MEVYLTTPRLPARKPLPSLLAAALSAAVIATLLSANLIGPEPRLASHFIPSAKSVASAQAVATGPSPQASQSQAASKPDQRKALVLFPPWLGGHSLGILKGFGPH